uniref:Sperm microtubule inner protein 1 C-terminal domain-containing protein n=1 Tax=Glossina morsitans morsitans TaxID=37546 RepID=A0A1B0FQD3_GLOMM
MNTKLNCAKISQTDKFHIPRIAISNREKLKSTTFQEGTTSNHVIKPMSKPLEEMGKKSTSVCTKNVNESTETELVANENSDDNTVTSNSKSMFLLGTKETNISKKTKSEILTLNKKDPLNSNKGTSGSSISSNPIKTALVSQKPKLTQKPGSFSSLLINSAKESGQSSKRIKRTKAKPAPTWKSPFKSFITKGVRARNAAADLYANGFAYDLSRDESKFAGAYKSPMKPASEAERELLRNGQRVTYLNNRYEYAPDRKYNYPEATSWRIGWFH